jgi:hypothetical protein
MWKGAAIFWKEFAKLGGSVSSTEGMELAPYDR